MAYLKVCLLPTQGVLSKGDVSVVWQRKSQRRDQREKAQQIPANVQVKLSEWS